MDYGLWDELRIDHGTEWALMLFSQCQPAQFRNDVSKPPYIQSSSKEVKCETLGCKTFYYFF